MNLGSWNRAASAGVFVIAAVLAGTRAGAEPLYTVSDLGQADPSANYLNALSADDQAVFRAGSFDPQSHPPGDLQGAKGYYYNYPQSPGSSIGWRHSLHGISSNSQGETIGYGFANAYAVTFVYRPEGPAPAWQDSGTKTGTFFDASSANIFGIAMNDHRQVIGPGTPGPVDHPSSDYHAFLDNRDLGTLGGDNSAPVALNNAGQVVGWSDTVAGAIAGLGTGGQVLHAAGPDGASHAFVYDKGIMEDLNTLIPPTAGLTLTSAEGIDANGRIVAFGTNASGATHEFLLTSVAPVPEPNSLALFAVMAGFIARRARAGRPARRRTISER